MPILEGDEIRLKQVLINLAKNALKFTKEGSIILTAHCDLRRNKLMVSVKDTGVGISKEDQKRLFSQFGKLDATAEINPDGIGLGLHICSQLVVANGGSISVDSEGKGHGTTFKFDMEVRTPSFEAEEDFKRQNH